MRLIVRNFLCVAVAVFVWVPAALAQSGGSGCTLDRVAWTFRQILRCQDGLTIVVEAGAQFTLGDRDGDGKVDSATLRLKALLIEGSSREGQGPLPGHHTASHRRGARHEMGGRRPGRANRRSLSSADALPCEGPMQTPVWSSGRVKVSTWKKEPLL